MRTNFDSWNQNSNISSNKNRGPKISYLIDDPIIIILLIVTATECHLQKFKGLGIFPEKSRNFTNEADYSRMIQNAEEDRTPN